MRVLLIGAVALLTAACASIGRPEGGPRDEVAPVFVRSTPVMGALNVDRTRLDLWFDENLKLEDPNNKVVISPVQKENARVNANGRHLTVEFRDTLRDTTTYVIDFADAIRDLNEGNILDGFSFDFSTGDHIDTLSVSGMVFQARNLEPAQGMVVGVYSNLADSAVSTLQLERVAKTNQYGQFTIRGLKPGNYNVFAIDDRNHDWHWDRSEDIAFFPMSVSPSVHPVEVSDTLRGSDGADSIVVRQGWEYLPNDLLLTWFNENYRSQYLRDNKRPDQRYLEFKFGAPVDTMPEFTIVNGPYAGRRLEDYTIMETRQERDSMIYWLRDTVLVNQDSLLLSARYQKTDSLDRLVWQTDTLKMFWKRPKVKEKKQKDKEKNDTTAVDSIPEIPFLDFKPTANGSQDLNLPMTFESPSPLMPVPDNGWRLEIARDTLWVPVPAARFEADSVSPRRMVLTTDWEEGSKYRMTIDSTAVSDIYGVFTKEIRHEFTTKKLEDYGNILLHITDLQGLALPDSVQVVVELLSSSDQPVATVVADKGGWAQFSFITPGTYYARGIIDLNHDGKWTTGNYGEKRLPEDVFYYSKKLQLRKNWDLEQDWSLLDTPVDAQKPMEIKKNRPQTKGPQQVQPEEDEYDEDDYFHDTDSWGNGSQYNNAGGNRRSGGFGGGGFGNGGMATQRRNR